MILNFNHFYRIISIITLNNNNFNYNKKKKIILAFF